MLDEWVFQHYLELVKKNERADEPYVEGKRLAQWLCRERVHAQLSYVMLSCGYAVLINRARGDGRWRIDGLWQLVYAKIKVGEIVDATVNAAAKIYEQRIRARL
jgi:hypothetical protein